MALVKFKNEYYVRCFRLATDGMSDQEIAKILGVPINRFDRWVRQDKALREGLDIARQSKDGYADFKSFIYERMPRKARELWDELDGADKLPTVEPTRAQRREKILQKIEDSAVQWQQSLFLHALVKCNFIYTKACMKIGINPGIVAQWCRDSEKFRQLVEGIETHKDDFFESCLIDLCRSGDSAAIIFANKTRNKKRGYDPVVDINTTTTGVVKHSVSIDELPVDARRAILETMRAKANPQLRLEDNRNAMDAEIVGE